AVFDPGWTDYRKTCLYAATDVTAQLREGGNAWGVMLGNGMYNVPGGRYVKFRGSFGPPKAIVQLHIDYTDGTAEDIGTDDSWRAARGPIVFSCIYGGEDYDARAELPGWDLPGFDDAAWKAAAIAEGPGGRLSAASAPPIKIMQTFAPVRATRLSPGKYVYDLGQNFSGRPWIRLQGPRGACVKLIPGELLDDKGRVSQRSSGGPMWFSYTLKGEGTEEWRPRFSYYGFRYLQAEGVRGEADGEEESGLPRLLDVAGEFTHSSAEVVGAFECANPLVNRIHALILASIRSNLQSVLTDCPHREKLGWLEVSHLLSDGLTYNFDAARFYGKIQQDMTDAQLDNGLVPDIAPEYTVFNGGFRDSPEWGSASVVNPWNTWLMYGDRRNLETHYETMRRYTEYLGATAKDHVVSHGLGDWYDIGPGGPGESKLTSKGLTATAVYYQDLCILQQAAALLGRQDQAEAFATLAVQVRDAFNAAFYHPNEGHYDRNSQTANAKPSVLDMVDTENRAAQSGALVASIQSAGGRVTAGDVGFSYLVRALTNIERGDLLYKMVCQADGPGYAYQLEHGATSLTEAWDTNPGSSQNHCMLGHVEGWFYRGLAGIRVDPAAPGFRHFILHPQFPEGLEWVKASYRSIRGPIASEWRVDKNGVTWSVQIPVNTTATVYIPAKDGSVITESGKPLGESEGLSEIRAESGNVIVEAASGTYQFQWTR
ncbi:MAG: alpha-L-rhamnosidase, partial [Candidatus Hydrogenedentes bacterium]|nr:alpha-L-rhamnosidase [Candidatus Hydrogenedentota bacterium]